MKLVNSNYLNYKLFVGVFLISLACLICDGLYYETVNDTVFQTFSFGLYNGGSNAIPNTQGCFILLSSIINKIHYYFPFINWHDVFELSILIIGLFLLLKLFYLSSPWNIIFLANWILSLSIAGVFFKPIEFTKTSILFASISLIYLYKKKEFCIVYLLFLECLFLLALLIRIEAGIIAFLIVTLFFLLTTQNIFHWLTKTMLSILLIIGVSLLVNLPKNLEDAYYLKIRGFEYALTDFEKEKATVHLTTKTDSCIFGASVKFFLADSSRCNIDFFKKIGLKQFDKTPSSLISKIFDFQFERQKVDLFIAILIKLKWIILLLLLANILLNRYHPRKNALLIANIFSFLSLIFVSIWLKPEIHVIYPIIALLILIDWFFILELKNLILPVKVSVLIIFFSICELFHQNTVIAEEKKKAEYYSTISKYLIKENHGNLVLNIGAWDEAHHQLFQKNDFSCLPNVYVLDGAKLYFNLDYQKLMKDKTNSYIFIEQWEYFFNSKNCQFLSSKSRMTLILNYINTIYNKKYLAITKKIFFSSFLGSESLTLFEIVDKNTLEK